jgi:3-oxo-5-alpha-steroid 4-dehydrogenase 1
MSLEKLELISTVWIGIAVVTHIALYFVAAPFGRHTSDKWGATIDNKLGWFLMELPSFLIMAYFLIWGSHSRNSYVWILFGLWLLHYFNRTFIYPLRIKATPKRMPLFIVGNAVLFNVVNAGTNGYFLAELASAQQYNSAWLGSSHFIVGALLFASGMAINLISDNMLIALRRDGSTGYKIPGGFLFEYVSSPNLLGEIIEWIGFAVMAWNLPALSFAVWTFANLVPRTLNHHHWYRRNFADYPANRKAVFPFLL